MEYQRESTINQGLASVHTGLGILLGTGRISTTTHGRILTLLKGLAHSPAKDVSDNQSESGESPIAKSDRQLKPNGRSSSAPPADFQAEAVKGKIICPWFSAGFKCRYEDTGTCLFLHEEVPNAQRDRLICPFWADGQRCNKAADFCRYAHYWASHKQLAPNPHASRSLRKPVVKKVQYSKPITAMPLEDNWGQPRVRKRSVGSKDTLVEIGDQNNENANMEMDWRANAAITATSGVSQKSSIWW